MKQTKKEVQILVPYTAHLPGPGKRINLSFLHYVHFDTKLFQTQFIQPELKFSLSYIAPHL